MQPVPNVVAGQYVNGAAVLLRAGEQAYLLNATNISSGQYSAAVQLERIKAGFYYPWGVSFEISFSGNPGTIDIEVQTADTDNGNNYVTISTLSGGLNANNVGRIELPSFWARYARIYCKTITNAVTTTVLVTR
jgi:hypothetical protein